MKRILNDEDVTRVLNQVARTPTFSSSDQIWFKINKKLEARQKHFWHSIVWKPWRHSVRWVMATGFLCVVYTGVGYHQNQISQMDQEDMGSYLLSIANPTDNATDDLGMGKVSVLLSEPSSSVPEVEVDNHLDAISADGMLL